MAITAPVTIIDRSHLRARSWTSPSGIDRVMARLGVALFTWAEARAVRRALCNSVLSHEENARQVHLGKTAQLRELEAFRLPQRMGF